MSENSFRYFRYPHHFSTYSSAPKTCDLCGQLQPGYDGPFYGLNKIKFVCEQCLISGKLADKDAFTNEGDLGTLRQQIKSLHPELTQVEIEKLTNIRDAELQQRTPHLVTWQDFFWPAHCGDYCCFIKEAGKPDLSGIAPEGKVHLLFGAKDDEFNHWWEGVRPDSPKDNSTSYSIGVYLFQCLHCHEYIVLWDCD